MNNNRLKTLILGDGSKHYDVPFCYELIGKEFSIEPTGKGKCQLSIGAQALCLGGKESKYSCIKCEDGVYLLKFDNNALILNVSDESALLFEGMSKALKSSGMQEYAEELDGGWLDVSFAPGTRMRMEFAEGRIIIDGSEFDGEYVKLAGSLFAICIADSDAVIVIDSARFLLYAVIGGTVVAGHAHLL